MKRIEISENGIDLVIDIEDGMARVRHFSAQIFDERYPLSKTPGLPFAGFRDELDRTGRLITLLCKNPETGEDIITRYRFFNGICAAEVRQRVLAAGYDAAKLDTCTDYAQLAQAVAQSDVPVFLLPSYTGMMEFRPYLARRTGGAEFWE